MFESVVDVQTIVDPQEAAESAGLRYVSDARPGIRRKGPKKGFTYAHADGSKLTEPNVLRRIKSLAVPPAWLPSFESVTQAKRNLRNAIKDVAVRLGNTPTICRKCYVHPELVTSYLDGNFVLKVKSENKLRGERSGLKLEEAAVLAMLQSGLGLESSPNTARARNARQAATTA